VIGNLYFITSFAFFMLGGLLALLIRAELFQPGLLGEPGVEKIDVERALVLLQQLGDQGARP